MQNDADGLVAALNSDNPRENFSKVGAFPHSPLTDENIAMVEVANLCVNSHHEFAIGPVFDQNVTKEEVMAEVRIWVEEYGAVFLRPLLEGASLSELSPATQLDRDVIRCLQNVLE